jgi:hypothetical protein
MRIIEIVTLENGAHRNQTSETFKHIPNGWAVIPDNMETKNFPFGEVEVKEIDGIMTVTKWTAGTLPKPESEPIPEPTVDDVLNALLGVDEDE